MKICSYSPKFKECIPFILNDNVKGFLKNAPDNFFGQIDKKLFLNFCIESNSIKIIKNIIRNQLLTETIKSNKETLIYLLKNKKLTISEKTYIYTKLIKNNKKLTEKLTFNLIFQYDKSVLFWLKNSKSLSNKEYKNLFNSEITEHELDFCRYKKLNIVNLILKSHQKQIICFEDYIDLFLEEELIKLINTGLKNILKEEDINLLDSIIKILIQNQSLIEKIEIELLKKIRINSVELFDFLNIDIEKVLLYKKFSQKKFKEKVKKI